MQLAWTCLVCWFPLSSTYLNNNNVPTPLQLPGLEFHFNSRHPAIKSNDGWSDLNSNYKADRLLVFLLVLSIIDTLELTKLLLIYFSTIVKLVPGNQTCWVSMTRRTGEKNIGARAIGYLIKKRHKNVDFCLSLFCSLCNKLMLMQI